MALRTLQEVIPNVEVLQTLRELQTSKHTIGKDDANDVIFLHGEPNCGNTSRIPLALSMLRGNVPVVSIQPTDAATAYICDVVKQAVDPAASVGHIPQTEAFNIDLMRNHKVLYVSARQFLLHSDEILQHASVVIVDEIHYNSVDHELSAVLLRERYRQQDPPISASIFLMTSYIQHSEMPEPLFETTTTVQIGRPDNSTRPSPVFKYDIEDRMDTQGYMETVVSTLKKINPADGPVLVFVPELAVLPTLAHRLRDEKLVNKSKKDESVWDVAPFIPMNESESMSSATVKLDKSIVLSLPYFHTHRHQQGISFKNVICPHWVRLMWYSEKYGKDVPQRLHLSRSEMKFLGAHGQQIWLDCTEKYYGSPDTWSEHATPLVKLLDPAGYYLKAHHLFRDRSPYAGAVNPLPLRYPVDDSRIAWFIHRAVFCGLVEPSRRTVTDRLVLNPRGERIVGFMLEVGLDFRWALFLTNIRTLINPKLSDDEEMVQELFDICIPLAIVMSKQELVLGPRAKDFHRNRYMSDAILLFNKDHQARTIGDAWCDAECLSLHLNGKLGGYQRTSQRWAAHIPKNLAAMVERARCLPQVTGDQHGTKTAMRTYETLFKARDPSKLLYGLFNTLLYGSATNNLAFVQQAYQGLDAEGNTSKGIGIATDISSGEKVILSRESLLDLDSTDIEQGSLYVTYNRLHVLKSPIDDDGKPGPSLMISGLSVLNKVSLSDAFYCLTKLPHDHTDSIRPYMAYLFSSNPELSRLPGKPVKHVEDGPGPDILSQLADEPVARETDPDPDLLAELTAEPIALGKDPNHLIGTPLCANIANQDGPRDSGVLLSRYMSFGLRLLKMRSAYQKLPEPLLQSIPQPGTVHYGKKHDLQKTLDTIDEWDE